MPPTPVPTRNQLVGQTGAIARTRQQQQAGATQQNELIVDPRWTGGAPFEPGSTPPPSGDPTRGYATACIGNLAQVGLTGFGIATYHGGTWTQL